MLPTQDIQAATPNRPCTPKSHILETGNQSKPCTFSAPHGLHDHPFTPHPSHPHTGTLARAGHTSLRGMALTSAVASAAAAAAAAAGAGKKAAQVQLQAELNNDDEWNKFMLRDGLLGESFLTLFNFGKYSKL